MLKSIGKKILKRNILTNEYFLLFMIVLFGLFLRIIFFSGMGISDSLAYSKTANDINIGKGIEPESTLTLSTRLGLIYATAFFYKLLGINDISSVIFVLLTSIASIILIFYFGKLLFNENVGLMAAFLLSFFPLDVVYSTQLVSDLPSAFFMSLGVYTFLYVELKRRLNYASYLLSGIFIGIGYMIRESALLIALFFIVYILYKRKIKKEYFLVPLGVIVIFALESLIFFSLTQDPLFRMHASQQYLKDASTAHNYFGRLNFPEGLFHYPWLFLTNNLLSFFYIIIFIAVAYLFICKKKEAYDMLLWFIPLLFYLSFGSASLTQYVPFRAVDRYTYIITVPGILLLAIFLSEKKEFIRRIMPLAVLLLLLGSIGAIYFREDRHLLDNLKEAYPFIKNLDKNVFIDGRSLKVLNYLSSYKNNENLKDYPKSLEIIKDSYIVINRYMIRNLKEANLNLRFPDEIENHPKHWRVIKEIGPVEEDRIIIYYIS